MSIDLASNFGEDPKRELQNWLITQPREVSIMIASRAALRLAPLATIGFQPSDERKQRRLEKLLSMLFRAAALSRTAATYADRMNGITTAAKHAAIRSQLVPAGALDTAATAAAFATFTDNPASDAANVASAHSLQSIAFNFSKDVSFREVDSNIWNQISTDVRFIAQRSTLTGTPLWTMANWANKTTSPLQTVVVGRQGFDGEPRALSPDWVLSYWRVIKAALPLKDDWDVWINWYEDRLAGRAQSEEYELVFASVPNEVWDRGPAMANRWIKEHLPNENAPTSESPQSDNLPRQTPTAAQFTDSGDGPIELIFDPAFSDATEEAEQREHYVEAREKLADLQALGPNLLGDIQRPVARALAAMPQEMAQLSIVRLWHRANALRERLSGHDEAAARQKAVGQLEPDAAMLAQAAVGPLRDFVRSYNVFIVGDCKGRELDGKSLGPGERQRSEAANAAFEGIISALPSAPQVASPEVTEVLSELNTTARSARPGLAGGQDIALARDSNANFVLALIRKGYRLIHEEAALASKGLREGAYRAVGASVAGGTIIANWPAITQFIAEHADTLKLFGRLVYDSPSISQMIDAITRHFVR